ncbi:MAG: hypothetical protein GY861_17935 [bacterium]|nr:hypothetical protein [bacterium]
MSLLKELLLDKKIFEAKEEIDKFIEEQGIEAGSVPQRLEFDKSVFTQVEQVDEFLKAHIFSEMRIDEEDDKYLVNMFDEVGFIEDTLKKIVIRDGVMIVVGFLRPMSEEVSPLVFKLPEKSMKFSSDLPYIIELAQVVNGFHPNYGKVELTKAHLLSFKNNFEKKVYGIDVSLDFDHETREAAGWLNEVFLSEDGNSLLGVVKWTPKGALSLSDREFRYFSPEFNLNWVHPHTGIAHGPTLLGGALVNRPFLKMGAIVGLKDKQIKGANVETIALSDHTAKVSDLEKDIATLKLSENTLKTTNQGMKNEITQLSEEVKTLKEEKAQAEKQASHKQLFDDGKINKAQLDALNEGKDMLDVLALSEKMNTKAAGDDKADNKDLIQLSDAEKKICAQLDMTEEDYVKYNKEGVQ